MVRAKGSMPGLTDERKQAAEKQIVDVMTEVDYDTKEYPVEIVVQKYLDGRAEDENELFIPDYQRDFAWDARRQSRFIESVIVGLPVPYVFVADTSDEPGKVGGRLEIVDGSQRIRTLAAFIQGDLRLEGLEKLSELNGFCFTDLVPSRQRRFSRRTIRMIELTEKANEEVRRDIFERINTGSEELNDMEKRRGIHKGPFVDFLTECAKHPLFDRLAPLSASAIKRREREEFILRFFAYLDRYQDFEHDVSEFLDGYIKSNQPNFDRARMYGEYSGMLEFAGKHFPDGFRKGPTHKRVFRIRFEALAVGTALALREKPNLVPASTNWLRSEEFRQLTTSDASNSRVKVVRRIEYVRNKLLD